MSMILQICDARVDHEMHQVQDVADFVSQDQEGLDELLFEFDIVGTAKPSHGCDHVFGDSEFGS